MGSKQEHAAALAARGFRTFPLLKNAKTPQAEGWQEKAGSYKTWWETKDSNIGVATGNGLLVLDFDVKKGGLETLSLMELEGALPETYRVNTPSGGVHLYYACPHDAGITVSADNIPNHAGLDVRCDGGLVVGAGSTIDGVPYTANDLPIAAAPPELIELCRRGQGRSKAVASTRQPLVELDTPDAIARADAWLAVHAPTAVHGERNITAFKVAARLREFGLSEPVVLDRTLLWNETVEPPLDADEIETTVKSAFRSATGAWGGASALADFEPVEILEPAKKPRAPIFALDFDEVAATALDHVADPLVEGLLDKEANSTLYGDSNSGKTFLMLDIAYHIATGRPWQGRAVAKGLVVYIAAEGGTGIRKRIAALKRHYGGEKVPFVLVPCPVNMLNGKADMPQLLALIREAEGRHGEKATLVVIDTLSRALAGGDENASTDMGGFIRNVDMLRAQTRAHVAIIHHTGKDQAKGARGWSGLRAAIDTEIEIAKGTVTVTKQRDLETTQPMKFTLDQMALGKDGRGRPVTSCVVRVLTGSEFVQVELTGEAQEMYEAFCDQAKQQVLDRGAPLSGWEKEPVSLSDWETQYIGDRKARKCKSVEIIEESADILDPTFRPPSVRHLRRLRTSVIESGHLREVSQNQWVKA